MRRNIKHFPRCQSSQIPTTKDRKIVSIIDAACAEWLGINRPMEIQPLPGDEADHADRPPTSDEADNRYMHLDGNHDPARRPSSEWRFHRDILKARPEVQAIVHAHPPYSTMLAIMGMEIPPVHYMVAVAGGDTIRCAPYATFGTQELSEHAVRALEGLRPACWTPGMMRSAVVRRRCGAGRVETLARHITAACVARPIVQGRDRKSLRRMPYRHADEGLLR